MKTPSIPEQKIPLLFAILTIAAYGLLLPFTGFYWDDWPFAWISRFQGPEAFFAAFDGVRPFLSPIFFVTTSLIPPIPLYWQIFALVIRFISGLSAWFALSQTWSQHKRQALIASVLFLLFPGYSQHWVAFTHVNQEWIPLIFYLLSFGYTARALRTDGKFRLYTLIALVFMLAGVFPTEYFIGLEPLRFFFIWVIISEKWSDSRQRLTKTFKFWKPYLVVWAGSIAWLAYFYTLGNYGSYDVALVKTPFTLLQILTVAADAIWKGGFYGWGQILILIGETFAAPASLLTLALIASGFLLCLPVVILLSRSERTVERFAWPALLAGITGLLLGRLPSFAAGLPLTVQSSNDRFMISMMIGGSLFATALVELLIRNLRVQNWIFASLIALAIGQQFFNANIFRRDWENQLEIYNQLTWRIPAMKPGTLLMTDVLPVDYETDLSFTAPLNWLYAPNYIQGDLSYAMLFTEIRLGGTLPTLKRNHIIEMGMRTVHFSGSTSQVIVIYMPENGCLRVLDSERGDQVTYAHLSRRLVDAIPLSDTSNIITDQPIRPRISFVAEPEPTWCYYYGRAEAAYQQQDWIHVVNLIDEAIGLGYEPRDPFEWLGYIEAQAYIGNIAKAIEISNLVLEGDGRTRRGLCEVWKRVQAEGQIRGDSGMSLEQILSDFECVQ